SANSEQLHNVFVRITPSSLFDFSVVRMCKKQHVGTINNLRIIKEICPCYPVSPSFAPASEGGTEEGKVGAAPKLVSPNFSLIFFGGSSPGLEPARPPVPTRTFSAP